MKNKQTSFDYVYRDLCDQIEIGRLAYGDTLASMSQLCELYHVGIRTVKDVMRALKEDGYIRTEERKPAVVIYRRDDSQRDSAIRSALRQKTSILQVYETMALILPPIFALSVRACEAEKIEYWARIFRNFDKKDAEKRKKMMASFLYFLLENSGNLLFRDLYSNYELYAKIPLFSNYEKFESRVLLHNEFNSLTWVAEAFLKKDSVQITHRFSVMYEAIVSSVQLLLEEFTAQYPNVPEDPSLEFSWNAHRGREHFYLQIARDLIDKIGTGVYPENTFLPSEAALAAQYNVCVSTIRNALSMLNEIGFAKTYNVKGTRVIWQDDHVVVKCMQNKAFKRDTLLYLSALQMMAMIVPTAVRLSAPAMDEQAKSELRQQLKKAGSIPIDVIVRCIVDHQPLRPMKTILQELCDLNIWGYYYSFFRSDPPEDQVLSRKCRDAVQYLSDGDTESLARCLFFCYTHILDFVRNFIVSCGLSEAAMIITPEYDRDTGPHILSESPQRSAAT
ncbi:GntR family transcriptional regulator [Bacilliculturomica massiliensis]|uniref:GntR family transcriptional regulator n=1 Tax=Bacilliculturomica massiliensis TaxID=1917867 RepID=UPI0013EF4748|nr:GntR family transcriptional regulator [Bacilliculturomica massiliensis]